MAKLERLPWFGSKLSTREEIILRNAGFRPEYYECPQWADNDDCYEVIGTKNANVALRMINYVPIITLHNEELSMFNVGHFEINDRIGVNQAIL